MNRARKYAEQCERDDEKRLARLRMEARMNTDPGELFWMIFEHGKFGEPKTTERALYRHDPGGATVSICWASMWSRVTPRLPGARYAAQSPRRWEDWRPVSHGRITLIAREVQAKIEMLHVHAPGRVEVYLRELCAGDNP